MLRWLRWLIYHRPIYREAMKRLPEVRRRRIHLQLSWQVHLAQCEARDVYAKKTRRKERQKRLIRVWRPRWREYS
jgi:hypothetical protein